MNPLEEKDGFSPSKDPALLVIFGATGDLAKKRLFPSLYNLMLNGDLPINFAIVGCGRKEIDFHKEIRRAIKPQNKALWSKFQRRVFYFKFDLEKDSYENLSKFLKNIDKKFSTKGNKLFHD